MPKMGPSQDLSERNPLPSEVLWRLQGFRIHRAQSLQVLLESKSHFEGKLHTRTVAAFEPLNPYRPHRVIKLKYVEVLNEPYRPN